MLTFNFNRIIQARVIEKPTLYLTKNGFSSNTATKIVNNRYSKINLAQIEKLCLLLHCTPNDFIQWTPNQDDTNYENQPLMSLLKTDKAFQISKVINSIPLAKLPEIEKLINDKLNETKP